MNDRLRKVLFSVTREYILSRRPVSSKRVLEVTDIKRSGATIRNDMKKLEEMGYLYQPHTSAGRIPTDKALRFYLDEVVEMESEMRKESFEVDMSPSFPIGDFETLIKALATILSRMAKGLVVMTKPKFSSLRIMDVHVTPITKNFSVVSAVTELGLSSVVPVRMIVEEVPIFERVLKMFVGKTFEDVSKMLETIEMRDESVRNVVETLKNVLKILSIEEDFVVRGISELASTLKGQEFLEVIKMVEDRKKIEEISSGVDENMRVFIGSENPIEGFENLATFVAPYRKGDLKVGSVVLMTSKYVPYERIYPMVEFVSNRLTEYLTVASREVI